MQPSCLYLGSEICSVETLCCPSHPYKPLGKVTCKKATSPNESDTAGLRCRAETIPFPEQQGKRSLASCLRAVSSSGRTRWALGGVHREEAGEAKPHLPRRPIQGPCL